MIAAATGLNENGKSQRWSVWICAVVVLGVLVGVSLKFGSDVWIYVSNRLLTPSERRATAGVVKQIREMQAVKLDELDSKALAIQRSSQEALQGARTVRDVNVASPLGRTAHDMWVCRDVERNPVLYWWQDTPWDSDKPKKHLCSEAQDELTRVDQSLKKLWVP